MQHSFKKASRFEEPHSNSNDQVHKSDIDVIVNVNADPTEIADPFYYLVGQLPSPPPNPCQHSFASEYPRFKPFFDELWNRTIKSKSERAKNGLEFGGLLYISDSWVTNGQHNISWEYYTGPVPENGFSMGEGFNNWLTERMRVLGLDLQMDWTFIAVHTHPGELIPTVSGRPGGNGGDYGTASRNGRPEIVVGQDAIKVYNNKGEICTIRRSP